VVDAEDRRPTGSAGTIAAGRDRGPPDALAPPVSIRRTHRDSWTAARSVHLARPEGPPNRRATSRCRPRSRSAGLDRRLRGRGDTARQDSAVRGHRPRLQRPGRSPGRAGQLEACRPRWTRLAARAKRSGSRPASAAREVAGRLDRAGFAGEPASLPPHLGGRRAGTGTHGSGHATRTPGRGHRRRRAHHRDRRRIEVGPRGMPSPTEPTVQSGPPWRGSIRLIWNVGASFDISQRRCTRDCIWRRCSTTTSPRSWPAPNSVSTLNDWRAPPASPGSGSRSWRA